MKSNGIEFRRHVNGEFGAFGARHVQRVNPRKEWPVEIIAGSRRFQGRVAISEAFELVRNGDLLFRSILMKILAATEGMWHEIQRITGDE